MTPSLYVKYAIQIQDLYFLHASFKNSLLVLKCLNVGYPETIRMLKDAEKDADEIKRNIDIFHKYLFNENLKLYRVYEHHEKLYINNMFERLRRDLSVLSNRNIDFKKTQYLEEYDDDF